MRPDPFKVWNPRRMSFRASRSVDANCHPSYKGTISANTSSASSINISLISGSASSTSAGSCSASCINGMSTAGISTFDNDAGTGVLSLSVCSRLSTDSRLSNSSSLIELASLSSSATSADVSVFSVSATIKPALIGCCATRLLLCKMIIAGSKLGGR